MEFLIIAIVIISIFSSITRQFKKNMKKEAPFDPWSFDSDSPEEDSRRLEEETEEEDFIEEEKPEIAHPIRQKHLQDTFSRPEKVEDDDSLPGKKEREYLKPSFLEDGRKEDLSTKDTVDFEAELNSLLLTGKKLPLGIVVSEILGPPRALRPYRRKTNQGTVL